MSKVILIVSDAMGFDACVHIMGGLEGLVEAGKARRWKIRSCLPSLSAPLYETIHTGIAPADHGIFTNHNISLSTDPSVFSEVVAAGKTTGAVASYMFSELYNAAPYDALRDMEVNDASKNIQHGRFYSELGHSSYNLNLPSDHDIFARTTLLIRQHAPDYVLAHTFSADEVGHVYGGTSNEYYQQCRMINDMILLFSQNWIDAGYRILFTADHGMIEDGRHGGTSDVERYVPLYDIGHPTGGTAEGDHDQRSIAPTVLGILGITPPATMTSAPLV